MLGPLMIQSASLLF